MLCQMALGRRNLIRIVMLLLTVTIAGTGCIYVAGPTWGAVVDKDTGQPINDAIVVRSWSDRNHTLGGLSTSIHSVSEKATNANGKYVFYPRLFLYPPYMIIAFTLMQENGILVYKPGYELFVGKQGVAPDPISLKKVGESYFVRHDAHEPARSDFIVGKTKLLSSVLSREENIIEHLDRNVEGIFDQLLRNVNDIAIDPDDNVYVSASNDLFKLSPDGMRMDIGRHGIVELRSDYYLSDIEFDNRNDLYALSKNSFKKIRFDRSAETINAPPVISGFGNVRTYELSRSKRQRTLGAVSSWSGNKKDSAEVVELEGYPLPKETNMRFAISPNRTVFILPMTYFMLSGSAGATVDIFSIDGGASCTVDIASAMNLSARSIMATDICAYGNDSALIAVVPNGTVTGGLILIDGECQVVKTITVNTKLPIVSVAALPDRNVVVATMNSFLVLNSDFDAIFTKDMNGTDLGRRSVPPHSEMDFQTV
jgi:hypothetical protein